jgi:hypothetical protein
MVSPLVPFLLGAGSQYLADEDASDKLKGDIIDGVSRQIYEVEIPEAQKQINNIKNIKQAVIGKYGQGVAEAFDNIGLYESGDQRLVDNEIEKYFTSLENRPSKITRDAFEKTVNELFEKSKLAGEEGQKAAALFKGRFGGQSMLALKTQRLQDRKEKVRELFDDRSNMRDLLVAPDAPKEGFRSILFGDRVTPQDVPGATGRLTEATQVDVPEPVEAAPRVSFSELGLGQEGVTDLREYDKKEDRPELRFFRQDFNNVVSDRILGGNQEFANVFPNYAEDYNNAIKFGGYKGTEQDYYRERYVKDRFKADGINYKSDVDVVDERAKKNMEETKARVEEAGLDPKTSGATKEERGEAFAFGDVGAEESIDYNLKLDAINISLSNAIAKVLADTSLTEEQRETLIETIKRKAQEEKQKLGAPPKSTMTGPLIP